jgi:uncharacterized protein
VELLWIILLMLAIGVVGLLGVALTVVGFSGAWLTLLAAIVLEWLRPGTFELWTLGVVGGLALLGEVIEFFASAAMAKRAGGSRAAAWWSVAGGLIGALLGTVVIPMPIVGTIVGAVVGSGVAATLAHRATPLTPWSEATRVGGAAASGRMLAIVVKTAIAAMIAGVLVVAVAW